MPRALHHCAPRALRAAGLYRTPARRACARARACFHRASSPRARCCLFAARDARLLVPRLPRIARNTLRTAHSLRRALRARAPAACAPFRARAAAARARIRAQFALPRSFFSAVRARFIIDQSSPTRIGASSARGLPPRALRTRMMMNGTEPSLCRLAAPRAPRARVAARRHTTVAQA